MVYNFETLKILYNLIIYFLNSDFFEMYEYYTPFTQKDSLKNS